MLVSGCSGCSDLENMKKGHQQDFESVGRGFESLRACFDNIDSVAFSYFVFWGKISKCPQVIFTEVIGFKRVNVNGFGNI